MRKIGIILPFIFLFMGCVESELIIPGENIGDGGGGETPSENFTLQSYDFESPFYNYQFNYNQDGQLTQALFSMEILGQLFTGTANFLYSNNLISQVNTSPEGMYSNQSVFTYNEQNQLIEINAGTPQLTNFVISHNENNISAVRTIDGVEENTFTFTTDAYGYINSYSFTDNQSGDLIEVILNLNDQLVGSNEVKVNGITAISYSFEYDNRTNPLYVQTIDYFNELMLNDAFEMAADDPTAMLDSYAMYRSPNNITSMTISNGPINTTLTYEYQYNTDNLPQSAVMTIEGEEPGIVTYTYY